MTTALKDKMAALGKPRRQKIEARAAGLIAEEMSLRDLRLLEITDDTRAVGRRHLLATGPLPAQAEGAAL